MLNGISLIDRLTLYENGKHRRYSLLFAVNGGAFAVAKLLNGGDGTHAVVLGRLTLTQLCVGMILFTFIMTVDIYYFGYRTKIADRSVEVFTPIGQAVLIAIGVLICAGWGLAGISFCGC